jgi:hypothetical protein
MRDLAVTMGGIVALVARFVVDGEFAATPFCNRLDLFRHELHAIEIFDYESCSNYIIGLLKPIVRSNPIRRRLDRPVRILEYIFLNDFSIREP